MENEIISKRGERYKHFDLGDGKKGFVTYTAPIHFKNSQNNWEDIVLNFKDDGQGNFIVNKNKVSCGFRKDKEIYKYFGLRYDDKHQFEATVNKIELNDIEQVSKSRFESIAKIETRQEISNKFNSNIEIRNRLNEVSLKNYFKINNSIEDFKIVEELHLKGLSCSNKKNGNQFIVDKYDRFNFIDEKGELKFWINSPFFIDVNGIKSDNVKHSLEEINGKFFYTKTPTKEGKDDLVLAQFPIEIDADTFYGTTADGVIWHQGSTTWATIHNAGTGTSVDLTDTGGARGVVSVDGDSDGKDDNSIQRAFFYFDTSSIGAGQEVTIAVFSLFGRTYNTSTVSVQKGTQADIATTADYDSFSGNYYVSVASGSWNTAAYNEFTFDAQGKSDIEMQGTTKLCVRDYTYDYLDFDPVDSQYHSGFWMADEEEAGEQRPRLVVTYQAAGGAENKSKRLLRGIGI